MNGIEHISEAFRAAQNQNRAAFMPYFTIGYPSLSDSLNILEAIGKSGADLIELGIPFSDPLADGPSIQHSTQVALQQGANVKACLRIAAELRDRGLEQPLLFMGYINPILAYGVDRFAQDAAQAGVDGLIVPDLPPEEAGELEAACQSSELALVFLLAPTSTDERIRLVSAHSTGFVYLVSITGITGARQSLPADLSDFILRVRKQTSKPLAVGFGVSTPEQARTVGNLAEGVIVGSALINSVREASEHPAQDAAEFVALLSSATQH